MAEPAPAVSGRLERPNLVPEGIAGVDAGLTLVKLARGSDGAVLFDAYEAGDVDPMSLLAAAGLRAGGVTGARLREVPEGLRGVDEIEAAVRGACALLAAGEMEGGHFLLILLGTGTAFVDVRDGAGRHLGGTALGGGSFAGVARRIEPSLRYREMIEGAGRGDRRRVDAMIADVYPQGIGRIGPDLTAAHFAKSGEGSLDDVLAALLNLHGENIAQIAAGRARMVETRRAVLAGGFAQENPLLVESLSSMLSMFGVATEVAPHPGFAGALGAALIGAEEVTA